nr:RNA-directed DNA polymerase, eukaryota [Tanacetum cinerariifolium]
FKAIYGEDGNLKMANRFVGRSCWSSIVNEVCLLRDRGVDIFEFMKLRLGNGNSIKLWTDNWFHGGILKDICSRMFALENRKDVSVSEKMGDPHLDGSFRRAIRGGCEQEQFQILEGVVNSTNLVQMEDRWVWNLESSDDFSVASFGRKIDDSRLPMVGDKTWWVKYMPIKINVLAWKVRVNALPTRFNLSRRGITIQYIICLICDCGVESTEHVFVRCCLTRQPGRMVPNWWNITYAEVDSIEEWKDWCSSLRLAVKSKMVFEGVWFTLW